MGAYDSAIAANQAAIAADLRQLARAPERFSIYAGYVSHNMEFCAWAAMYAGHEQAALHACEQLDAFLDETRLRSHPMLPSFFEAYTTTRLMVLVRFGRWDTILALPFKADPELYLAHTLFLHFARGVALGATGDVPAARAEQARFAALASTLSPETRRKHNVNLAEHSAPIAADILEAELLYRKLLP